MSLLITEKVCTNLYRFVKLFDILVRAHTCLFPCITGAEQGIPSTVEQVIGKMKNHETARITVKPKYGFGEEGSTKRNIPNDADLVYEVRLNNFTKVCYRCRLHIKNPYFAIK